MRGVPDEQIGVVVDTTSVADRIFRGLMEHRSQRHVITGGVDGDRWARMVAREHLVVPWPPRREGDLVLTDVLKGLD